MPIEHYVLTQDPQFLAVIDFIKANGLQMECHLNRTRFWIDVNTALYSEFVLRYSPCCHRVDPLADLATGF